jgi:hypothetical protein
MEHWLFKNKSFMMHGNMNVKTVNLEGTRLGHY